MATKKERVQDKAEAIESLRDWLRAGQEVSVLTTTVSRSGMSRGLRFFITAPYESGSAHYSDGGMVGTASYPDHGTGAGPYVDKGRGASIIHEITYYVARTGAAGMRRSRDGNSATIGGCGMDMHFAAVDALAYTIGLPLRYRSL